MAAEDIEHGGEISRALAGLAMRARQESLASQTNSVSSAFQFWNEILDLLDLDEAPVRGPAMQELLSGLRLSLQGSSPVPGLLAIGELFLALRNEELQRRERAGLVYTPRRLARYMGDTLLNDWKPDASVPTEQIALPRLLDPASGCGAFLLCCAQQILDQLRYAAIQRHGAFSSRDELLLRRRICREVLHGCDTDIEALQIAGRLLARWSHGSFSDGGDGFRLVHANALSSKGGPVEAEFPSEPAGLDWTSHPLLGCSDRGYSHIIANPPYMDSESMAGSSLRRFIRLNYRSARGNWDIYIPFIERSIDLLAPGGRLVAVVPARLLCADYAAAIQRIMLEQKLELLDLQEEVSFSSAKVWTVVASLRKEPGRTNNPVGLRDSTDGRRSSLPQGQLRRLPDGYLAAAFSSAAEFISDLIQDSPALGSILACSDGCSTDEAYRLKNLISDDAEADGPKLLNTGLIDPYRPLWGKRPCRYLGGKYLYPVIDGRRLEGEMPRRSKQAGSPKLLVAGLSARIECLVDEDGSYLCGKAAVQLLPRDEVDMRELDFICGLLNSRFMNWLYRSLFGLRAYSSRAMNIGPRQLEKLPLRRGAQCPRIGDLAMQLVATPDDAELLAELDRQVEVLYGVDRLTRRVIEEELEDWS